MSDLLEEESDGKTKVLGLTPDISGESECITLFTPSPSMKGYKSIPSSLSSTGMKRLDLIDMGYKLNIC